MDEPCCWPGTIFSSRLWGASCVEWCRVPLSFTAGLGIVTIKMETSGGLPRLRMPDPQAVSMGQDES